MDPLAQKRTISGTFRIREDVYNAIQQEAKEREVSLNNLVNQMLCAHVFEDMPVGKAIFVTMPKSTYSEFLSSVSEGKAKQIGRLDAERVAKSIILAKHGEITKEAIIEHLRLFAERAGYGEYREVSDNSKRIITIMHEFGLKGSALFAAHAETLFQMIGLRPRMTTTEGALVIEI